MLGNYSLSAGSFAVSDTIGSVNRFYRAKLGTAYLGTQVGFIKKTASDGYSMIANQLDNGDNTIATLFPGVPTGTTLFKWDESAQQYVSSVYAGDQWDSPSMTLHPGEGAVLQTGGTLALRFVGQVRDAFLIPLPHGMAIRSSPVPQSGGITSALAYPGTHLGDQVSQMTDASGTYATYSWNLSAWTPSEPIIGIGESFWSNKVNEESWKRVFWTWP